MATEADFPEAISVTKGEGDRYLTSEQFDRNVEQCSPLELHKSKGELDQHHEIEKPFADSENVKDDCSTQVESKNNSFGISEGEHFLAPLSEISQADQSNQAAMEIAKTEDAKLQVERVEASKSETTVDQHVQAVISYQQDSTKENLQRLENEAETSEVDVKGTEKADGNAESYCKEASGLLEATTFQEYEASISTIDLTNNCLKKDIEMETNVDNTSSTNPIFQEEFKEETSTKVTSNIEYDSKQTMHKYEQEEEIQKFPEVMPENAKTELASENAEVITCTDEERAIQNTKEYSQTEKANPVHSAEKEFEATRTEQVTGQHALPEIHTAEDHPQEFDEEISTYFQARVETANLSANTVEKNSEEDVIQEKCSSLVEEQTTEKISREEEIHVTDLKKEEKETDARDEEPIEVADTTREIEFETIEQRTETNKDLYAPIPEEEAYAEEGTKAFVQNTTFLSEVSEIKTKEIIREDLPTVSNYGLVSGEVSHVSGSKEAETENKEHVEILTDATALETEDHAQAEESFNSKENLEKEIQTAEDEGKRDVKETSIVLDEEGLATILTDQTALQTEDVELQAEENVDSKDISEKQISTVADEGENGLMEAQAENSEKVTHTDITTEEQCIATTVTDESDTGLKEAKEANKEQVKISDISPEEKVLPTILTDETTLDIEDIDVQAEKNSNSIENVEKQIPVIADEGLKEAEEVNKEQVKINDNSPEEILTDEAAVDNEEIELQAEENVNSKDNSEKQIPTVADEGEIYLAKAEAENNEQVTITDTTPEEKGLATISTDEKALDAEDIDVQAEESFHSVEKLEELIPTTEVRNTEISPEEKDLVMILANETSLDIQHPAVQAEETSKSKENLEKQISEAPDKGDTCVKEAGEENKEQVKNTDISPEEKGQETIIIDETTQDKEYIAVQAGENFISKEILEIPKAVDEDKTDLMEAEAENNEHVSTSEIGPEEKGLATILTDETAEDIEYNDAQAAEINSKEVLEKQIPTVVDEGETDLTEAEADCKEHVEYTGIAPEQKSVETILRDEPALNLEDVEQEQENFNSKENLENQIPTAVDEGEADLNRGEAENNEQVKNSDITVLRDETALDIEDLQEKENQIPKEASEGEEKVGHGDIVFDHTPVNVYSTELAGDNTVEESFQVQSHEEAEQKLGVKDEKSEDHPERNDMIVEEPQLLQVLEEPKITSQDFKEEQIIGGNVTIFTPESIEEDTVKNSQDNEKEENANGLSPEYIPEDGSEKFKDDKNDAVQSEGEILEHSQNVGVEENTTCETKNVKNSEEILSTLPVKYDQESSPAPKEALKEENIDEDTFSVQAAKDNDGDNGAVTVTETCAKAPSNDEEDSPQVLKYEPGEEITKLPDVLPEETIPESSNEIAEVITCTKEEIQESLHKESDPSTEEACNEAAKLSTEGEKEKPNTQEVSSSLIGEETTEESSKEDKNFVTSLQEEKNEEHEVCKEAIEAKSETIEDTIEPKPISEEESNKSLVEDNSFLSEASEKEIEEEIQSECSCTVRNFDSEVVSDKASLSEVTAENKEQVETTHITPEEKDNAGTGVYNTELVGETIVGPSFQVQPLEEEEAEPKLEVEVGTDKSDDPPEKSKILEEVLDEPKITDKDFNEEQITEGNVINFATESIVEETVTNYQDDEKETEKLNEEGSSIENIKEGNANDISTECVPEDRGEKLEECIGEAIESKEEILQESQTDGSGEITTRDTTVADKTEEETSLQNEEPREVKVSNLAREKLDSDATKEETTGGSEVVLESDSKSIDVVSKDEVISDQTLNESISKESSTLLVEEKELGASEHELETTSQDKNIEEEHAKEVEVPTTNDTGDLLAPRSAEGTCLPKEEPRELKVSELALEKLEAGESEEEIKETFETVSKLDSQSIGVVSELEILEHTQTTTCEIQNVERYEEIVSTLPVKYDQGSSPAPTEASKEENTFSVQEAKDNIDNDIGAVTVSETCAKKNEEHELCKEAIEAKSETIEDTTVPKPISEEESNKSLVEDNSFLSEASEKESEKEIQNECSSTVRSFVSEVVSDKTGLSEATAENKEQVETTHISPEEKNNAGIGVYNTELVGETIVEPSFQVQPLEEEEAEPKLEVEDGTDKSDDHPEKNSKILEEVQGEPKITARDFSEEHTTEENVVNFATESIVEETFTNYQDDEKEIEKLNEEGSSIENIKEGNAIDISTECVPEDRGEKLEECIGEAVESKEEILQESQTDGSSEITTRDTTDADKIEEETTLQNEEPREVKVSNFALEKLDSDATEEETTGGSEVVPESDSKSIDVVTKDEVIADQTLYEGISKVRSTLLAEETELRASEHELETTSQDKNIEEEHAKEVEVPTTNDTGDLLAPRSAEETCLPKEEPRELKVSELALEKLEAGESKEEIKETFETVSKFDSQSIGVVSESEILEHTQTTTCKIQNVEIYEEIVKTLTVKYDQGSSPTPTEASKEENTFSVQEAKDNIDGDNGAVTISETCAKVTSNDAEDSPQVFKYEPGDEITKLPDVLPEETIQESSRENAEVITCTKEEIQESLDKESDASTREVLETISTETGEHALLEVNHSQGFNDKETTKGNTVEYQACNEAAELSTEGEKEKQTTQEVSSSLMGKETTEESKEEKEQFVTSLQEERNEEHEVCKEAIEAKSEILEDTTEPKPISEDESNKSIVEDNSFLSEASEIQGQYSSTVRNFNSGVVSDKTGLTEATTQKKEQVETTHIVPEEKDNAGTGVYNTELVGETIVESSFQVQPLEEEAEPKLEVEDETDKLDDPKKNNKILEEVLDEPKITDRDFNEEQIIEGNVVNDVVTKDEIIADQTLNEEISKEPSTLLAEEKELRASEHEHGTTSQDKNIEEGHAKEVEVPTTDDPGDLFAPRSVEETCLPKEEPIEKVSEFALEKREAGESEEKIKETFETVSKFDSQSIGVVSEDEIITDQTQCEAKTDAPLQIPSYTLLTEEKYVKASEVVQETLDAETPEEEIKDGSAMVPKFDCESTDEVLKDDVISDQTLQEGLSTEQLQKPSSALLPEEKELGASEHEHDTTTVDKNLDEENPKEVEVPADEDKQDLYAATPAKETCLQADEPKDSVLALQNLDAGELEEEIKGTFETVSKSDSQSIVVASGDDILADQTLCEGITDPPLSKDREFGATELALEKVDAEDTEEIKVPEIVTKFDSESIEIVSNNEVIADQTFNEGITKEQIQSPSSTLLPEEKEREASEPEHETIAEDKNTEQECTKEVEMSADEDTQALFAAGPVEEKSLQKEEPSEVSVSELAPEKLHAGDTEEANETFETVSEPDFPSTVAVSSEEIIVDETLSKGVTDIPLEIPSYTSLHKEKELKASELDLEKQDADIPEEEIKEGFEVIPQSNSQSTYEVLKDEIIADQLQIPSSALVPDEKEFKASEHEYETTTDDKNIDDENLKEVEEPIDEATQDLFSARSTVESCLQKEKPSELKVPEVAPEKLDADETEEVKETFETVSKSDSESIYAVSKDELTDDQTLCDVITDMPLHIPSYTSLTKENELNPSELALEKLDANATEEVKGAPGVTPKSDLQSIDVVVKDEIIADQVLHEVITKDQLHIQSSMLLPEEMELKESEHEHGTATQYKNLEKEYAEEIDVTADEDTRDLFVASSEEKTQLQKEEPRELKVSELAPEILSVGETEEEVTENCERVSKTDAFSTDAVSKDESVAERTLHQSDEQLQIASPTLLPKEKEEATVQKEEPEDCRVTELGLKDLDAGETEEETKEAFETVPEFSSQSIGELATDEIVDQIPPPSLLTAEKRCENTTTIDNAEEKSMNVVETPNDESRKDTNIAEETSIPNEEPREINLFDLEFHSSQDKQRDSSHEVHEEEGCSLKEVPKVEPREEEIYDDSNETKKNEASNEERNLEVATSDSRAEDWGETTIAANETAKIEVPNVEIKDEKEVAKDSQLIYVGEENIRASQQKKESREEKYPEEKNETFNTAPSENLHEVTNPMAKDSGVEISQEGILGSEEACGNTRDIRQLEKESHATNIPSSNEAALNFLQDPTLEDTKPSNDTLVATETKEEKVSESGVETADSTSAQISERLMNESTKERMKVITHLTEEKEPTVCKELHADKEEEDEEEHENVEEAKTDEEKEDTEHKRTYQGYDEPVIVEASTDTEVKVKKSHNILSGMGSKVKHSISKVKKAIIGKSSNSKTQSEK